MVSFCGLPQYSAFAKPRFAQCFTWNKNTASKFRQNYFSSYFADIIKYKKGVYLFWKILYVQTVFILFSTMYSSEEGLGGQTAVTVYIQGLKHEVLTLQLVQNSKKNQYRTSLSAFLYAERLVLSFCKEARPTWQPSYNPVFLEFSRYIL